MSHRLGDCPICKKPFASGDDIVICPYCGAPYHRACYAQQGHCSFEDRHKEGFEYRPTPKKAKEPADSAAAPASAAAGETAKTPPSKGKVRSEAEGGPKRPGGILCERCRTINDARNIFCEKCGAPLHGAATGSKGEGAGTPFGSAGPGGLFGGFGGFAGPGPGGEAGPETAAEIDGIPREDWAAFVGKNAPVYLARLTQMQSRGGKTSFMLSAFFVPYMYFAYRKLWGWMVLALVSNLAGLGTQVLMAAFSSGLLSGTGFSQDTMWMISVVGSYLFLAIQAVFGLFAMHLYRRAAAKKIQALRHSAQNNAESGEADTAAQREALAQKGGVCVPAAVAMGVGLVLLSAVLSYFLGDAMLSYLLAMI